MQTASLKAINAVRHFLQKRQAKPATAQTSLPTAIAKACYFHYSRMMEENEIVRSLAALAHPARLQVFRALVVVGQQGLIPGTMAQALSMPSNTLSFHLKELMHAGLVTQERQGRNLVYRAAFDRMNSVLGYLTAHCCKGEECLDPAARVACC